MNVTEKEVGNGTGLQNDMGRRGMEFVVPLRGGCGAPLVGSVSKSGEVIKKGNRSPYIGTEKEEASMVRLWGSS